MNKKSIILVIMSLLFLAAAIFYKTTPCEKVIVSDKNQLTIANYRIYFLRGSHNLWSMEADGSDIKRVNLPEAISTRWSENGNYIAMAGKNVISLYDFNTQQLKKIGETYSNMSYSFYFNKDSTKLAVLSDCRSIYCKDEYGDDWELWLFSIAGEELEHIKVASKDLDETYDSQDGPYDLKRRLLVINYFPDSFKDGIAHFYGSLSSSIE